MATERLEMRQIREILRLRWQEGLTIRQAALSVGRSVGAVQQAAARATAAGLDWATVEGWMRQHWSCGCTGHRWWCAPIVRVPIRFTFTRSCGA